MFRIIRDKIEDFLYGPIYSKDKYDPMSEEDQIAGFKHNVDDQISESGALLEQSKPLDSYSRLKSAIKYFSRELAIRPSFCRMLREGKDSYVTPDRVEQVLNKSEGLFDKMTQELNAQENVITPDLQEDLKKTSKSIKFLKSRLTN